MIGSPPAEPWLAPDAKIAHKLASTWVAAFWGATGTGLTIATIFVNMDNVFWLGPVLIIAAASFAVARFTNQPGTV